MTLGSTPGYGSVISATAIQTVAPKPSNTTIAHSPTTITASRATKHNAELIAVVGSFLAIVFLL
jgi:hypothetical protein